MGKRKLNHIILYGNKFLYEIIQLLILIPAGAFKTIILEPEKHVERR
jgi:hypothetical protein